MLKYKSYGEEEEKVGRYLLCSAGRTRAGVVGGNGDNMRSSPQGLLTTH